ARRMSWRPRPVRGRSLLLVVGGRPRVAGGGAGALPRGLPGAVATWCTLHFGYVTTSGGACADRFWTLESAAVTRHLESLWATHRSRCLLVVIGGGITSLVRQCLSSRSPAA